jgi:hypothetical protein
VVRASADGHLEAPTFASITEIEHVMNDDAGMSDDGCGMRQAAVTAIGGHGTPVVTVSTGCVHEHVTTGVRVCANCLSRHAADPLCCRPCELALRHCCPLALVPVP